MPKYIAELPEQTAKPITKKEYIKKNLQNWALEEGGFTQGVCPMCRKPLVYATIQGFWNEGIKRSIRHECQECQAEWLENFKFTGFTILGKGYKNDE